MSGSNPNDKAWVFDDYDMVVSIRTDVISEQLQSLQYLNKDDPGYLPGEIGARAEWNKQQQKYEYKMMKEGEQPPNNEAYLQGGFTPEVKVKASGSRIVFIIHFTSGKLWSWRGPANHQKLKEYSLAGWRYALSMNIDQYTLSPEAREKVPTEVKKQLEKFSDDMFSVKYLMLNFTTLTFLEWDNENTKIEGDDVDDDLRKDISQLLGGALKGLQAGGKNFILGYSVENKAKNTRQLRKEDAFVDQLKPTGATFTMVRDTGDEKLNTLNYLLVTKKRGKKITGAAPVFDTNWLSSEDGNAKMVIARQCFTEDVFVKPVYDKVRDKIYEEVKKELSCTAGRTFEEAQKMKEPTSNQYTIQNYYRGNTIDDPIYEHYWNTISYSRPTEKPEGTARYTLSGGIIVHKTKTENYGVCTALANRRIGYGWKINFDITTYKNKEGKPQMNVEANTVEAKYWNDHTFRNNCALTWGALKEILTYMGGIVFALIFQDVEKWLADDWAKFNFGDMHKVATKLAGEVQSRFLLPGGAAFSFTGPDFYDNGDLSLRLTYKTGH